MASPVEKIEGQEPRGKVERLLVAAEQIVAQFENASKKLKENDKNPTAREEQKKAGQTAFFLLKKTNRAHEGGEISDDDRKKISGVLSPALSRLTAEQPLSASTTRKEEPPRGPISVDTAKKKEFPPLAPSPGAKLSSRDLQHAIAAALEREQKETTATKEEKLDEEAALQMENEGGAMSAEVGSHIESPVVIETTHDVQIAPQQSRQERAPEPPGEPEAEKSRAFIETPSSEVHEATQKEEPGPTTVGEALTRIGKRLERGWSPANDPERKQRAEIDAVVAELTAINFLSHRSPLDALTKLRRLAEEGKITPEEFSTTEILIEAQGENQETLERAAEAAVRTLHEPGVMDAAAVTALPEGSVEDRARLKERLKTPAALEKIGKNIKDFFVKGWPISGWKGSWKELAVSFVVGGSVRAAVRWTLGGFSGAGIIAGAAAGAATGWRREFVAQRKDIQAGKFSRESILEKLSGARDLTERALIIRKAEEALQSARVSGNKKEVERLSHELYGARTLARAEALKEEHLSIKDGVLAILNIADEEKKGISMEHQEEVRSLLQSINFEAIREFDRRKISGAILRGAAVGALGGYLGGLASDWISDHAQEIRGNALVHWISEKLHLGGAEDVAPAEEVARHIEVAAAPTREALKTARDGILGKNFVGHFEKGEGFTHAARRMIHDYLVNEKNLNPDFKPLSIEQLVYAEDALRRQIEKAAEGSASEITAWQHSGEALSKIVNSAQSLSHEQVENLSQLLKDPAHHLSSKTIESMTNLNSLAENGNGFYVDAIKSAGKQATRMAAETLSVPPGAQETVDEGTKSAISGILQNPYTWGALGVGGLGIGYGAVRLFRREADSRTRGSIVQSTLGLGRVVAPTKEAGKIVSERPSDAGPAPFSAETSEAGQAPAPEEQTEEPKKNEEIALADLQKRYPETEIRIDPSILQDKERLQSVLRNISGALKSVNEKLLPGKKIRINLLRREPELTPDGEFLFPADAPEEKMAEFLAANTKEALARQSKEKDLKKKK